MKNVFGLNLTDKKASVSQDDMDGAVFITNKLDVEEIKRFSSIQDEIDVQSKKLRLPLPLSIIKGISYLVGMICVIALLRARVTMQEAFDNAPWVFYMMFVFLGIALVLTVIERIIRAKHSKSGEFKEHLDEVEKMAEYSMRALNIPENAPAVDVLMYEYKLKKDKIVPYRKMYTHTPMIFYVYHDESCLYLGDHTMVLTFNKRDFKSIDRVNKSIEISCWNKDKPFNSPEYKKYKIYANNLGTLQIKYHYSMKISSDYGEYEILIPPYEAEVFAGILGLPVNDNTAKK